jgi:hypothetical protein
MFKKTIYQLNLRLVRKNRKSNMKKNSLLAPIFFLWQDKEGKTHK